MKDLTPGLDVYVCLITAAILAATTVSFTAGETVFDVLNRICNERNIQIEYSSPPYTAATTLRALTTCMNLIADSNWLMYKVNGWFPQLRLLQL